MATSSTDRWDSLDFGPPPGGGEEPKDSVLLEVSDDGHVATITLNRPHADIADGTVGPPRQGEV